MRLLQTQESVNPYMRVVTPVSGTEYDVSRAIIVTNAIANATTLTFSDGTEVILPIDFPEGVYSFGIKEVTASTTMNVALLY
jgi:hypothetical protein